jgi:hypothetical protein
MATLHATNNPKVNATARQIVEKFKIFITTHFLTQFKGNRNSFILQTQKNTFNIIFYGLSTRIGITSLFGTH